MTSYDTSSKIRHLGFLYFLKSQYRKWLQNQARMRMQCVKSGISDEENCKKNRNMSKVDF